MKSCVETSSARSEACTGPSPPALFALETVRPGASNSVVIYAKIKILIKKRPKRGFRIYPGQGSVKEKANARATALCSAESLVFFELSFAGLAPPMRSRFYYYYNIHT